MFRNKSLTQILDPSSLIVEIRKRLTMLDTDLAKLYGTTTKHLNEQVMTRNGDRFSNPEFIFRLKGLISK